MPFCTHCGKELLATDLFCWNCGSAVRALTPGEQAPGRPASPTVKGLGRNTVVYLTRQGLVGTKVRSNFVLFLAFALPIPILLSIYAATLSGPLAVYATVWLAASTFLYDELRGRGLGRLQGFDPEAPNPTRSTWLVPWHTVRMADWNGRTLWFSSADPSRKASVTFDKNDAPAVERTLGSFGIRYSWRPPRLPAKISGFWSLAIMFFVVSQVIMILAATQPFFPGEELTYTTVLNSTRSQITGASFLGELHEIYLNNLQVALGGALPFLGTLTFGLASYNTGRVIQVIAISDNVSPAAVLLTLYILPHTWVEEFSYPMATVAGLLAVTRWDSVSPGEFVSRRNRASGKYLMALGGVAVTLMVAGLLEASTTYLRYAVVALWVPLIAVAYMLWKAYNRRRNEVNIAGTPPSVSPDAGQST